MKQSTLNQRTITFSVDDYLDTWIEAFLFDRKSQSLSKGTIKFYNEKLAKFSVFCNSQITSNILDITPNLIREYLVYLSQNGHNQGGVHCCYRALKTFLYWWEDEVEAEGWKNPIRKVKAPINPKRILPPVSLDDISSLLNTCDSSFTGIRDKALILCLLDTGVRASELISMNLNDIERTITSIYIQKGKGNKSRTVFLGKKTRRALRTFLKMRNKNGDALWVTNTGTRLTYWGLRQIIRRRANTANITTPGLHDFRRAFALQCLRNGVDVYSLQKMMGHADLQVLQRYLAQTTDDIKAAHRRGSPVDNAW